MDIDFRRVPEIWSYLTADKAEKAPNKPRDPVLSVYISQPDSGDYTQLNDNDETGHSGIGIEFSRFSQISQRWEGYNLRYGFFTQGGMPAFHTDAITGYHQATHPGQLMDERNFEYDVSRSYTVSNRQVNDVLKASKTYADKGYNNYTRNCTTFVREMVVDHAKIHGAAPLFKPDTIEFNAKTDRRMFGASLIESKSKTSFEAAMNKLTHGNDCNYQGFGNKRATKEDYDRYKDSLSYFRSAPDKADLPSVDAET